ncbi:hypothetical protein Btru_003576 [Bulinus truncatus]|nr:hypothetical protein Btru_003576 [Bulinus truncatus]
MSPNQALTVTSLCLISLSVILSHVTAVCPVPPPCQCDISIHCEIRNLTSIPAAGSTGGESFLGLYLSRNSIKEIKNDSFMGYHVSSIDLSHNPLTYLDNFAFRGMEDYLLELNLEDVHITSIPLSIAELKNLRTLNIQNNPIVGLSPTITSNIGQSLINFSFGRTKIRYWPTALNNLVNLQTLDMSHNLVTYMRDGAVTAFSNTLRELHLANASLSTFQKELSYLKVLTLLDLSYNNIAYIPPTALVNVSLTLTKLLMQHNHLTYIPDALYHLMVLEELDVSFNTMLSTNADIIGTSSSSLLENSASTLRLVNLSFCGLNAVPRAITSLRALEVLDLSGNKIVALVNHQFISLPQLKTLFLNDNPLMSIPYLSFSGLTSLSQLNLARCRLSYIPSSSIQEINSLATLDLSSNQITRIIDIAFPGAGNLTTVDLSNNTLMYIFDLAFYETHSMRTLRLSRCSLTKLPISISQADGLRTVFVDGNPIPCDCDLSWILNWQRQAGIIPSIVGRCADNPTMAIGTYVSSKLSNECAAPHTSAIVVG